MNILLAEATEKDKTICHQWALHCSHGSSVTPHSPFLNVRTHHRSLSIQFWIPSEIPRLHHLPHGGMPQLRVLRGRQRLGFTSFFLHDNIHPKPDNTIQVKSFTNSYNHPTGRDEHDKRMLLKKKTDSFLFVRME